MENIYWLNDFLILFSCLVAIDGIVIPGQHEVHQTKNQAPQKCDLICPGQPSLTLPPNFIQNCTIAGNHSATPSKTTTRPPRTTTVESGEDESTEINETNNSQKSTTRITKPQKSHKEQAKTHQVKPQTKHKLKKNTIIFTQKAKARLFKHRRHFLKEKAQLDGCYVICSEQNGSGAPPENGNSEEEPDSGESDSDDNYVEGEDTPVEIIYISRQAENSKKPSEFYQINNYELVQPQPAFGFGYDPLFIEGKQKKIEKKKKHNRKSRNHQGPNGSKVKQTADH